MTNARREMNPGTSRRTKVTYGVIGGIATGVFLGDLVTHFQVVGDVYLGLLRCA